MLYIYTICLLTAVIMCFPSPKGLLVTQDMIEVFNSEIEDTKLDSYESYTDNILEKFLDDKLGNDFITANLNESIGNKPTRMEDVGAKDILESGFKKGL